jgi:hypothetical protein
MVEEEEKNPADEKEDKNLAGEKYKIRRDRFDFFDRSLPVFPMNQRFELAAPDIMSLKWNIIR